MPITVQTTSIADRQIAGLRGRRRRTYDEFERDLMTRGCAALGYRLTGEEPLSSLCVKHLHGADRVVVAFAADEAWVLIVGPHAEGDKASDVYTALYLLADVPPPSQPRSKPPCCVEDEDEVAPEIHESLVDDLVRRARKLSRRS